MHHTVAGVLRWSDDWRWSKIWWMIDNMNHIVNTAVGRPEWQIMKSPPHLLLFSYPSSFQFNTKNIQFLKDFSKNPILHSKKHVFSTKWLVNPCATNSGPNFCIKDVALTVCCAWAAETMEVSNTWELRFWLLLPHMMLDVFFFRRW